ncbi:MAG: TldD/PmbA family protein [Thermoplasmata archaeon]|nr:TldD/PmbA family protein [Thermoplasmata archaeon]
MSAASSPPARTAHLVADQLRGKLAGPWDVYGERIRRYEVHVNGAEVEMFRGPIHLEGYGLRLFRPVDGGLGSGFSSTTDLSADGIDETVRIAEETTPFSRSPAKSLTLPSKMGGPGEPARSVDLSLWERPEESLRAYVHGLLSAFDGHKGVVPSFGSVRVTLTESSLANSEGAEQSFAHSTADVEFAVKAFGGPEGPAPGEYWVNSRARTLTSTTLPTEVADWCRKAEDARQAKATPTGDLTVLFPASVLADVLPAILGYRFGGAAQLRKMAPPIGSSVGSEKLTVHDDGLFPLGLGTSPFDDEGVAQSRRPLIEGGTVKGHLQDLVYASALGARSTGNGLRDSVEFAPWFHFTRGPSPGATTLVVAPGDGGSDAELLEGVEDGIWLDQLGYAFPDPVSGSFGGEIRMGYRVRNGRLAEPIRGGTVGGLVFGDAPEGTLFGGVSGIGSRPTLAGHLSTPTIRVGGFPVAGGP